MFVDDAKYVNLMTEMKLTPNQFLFLYLTSQKKYNLLFKHAEEGAAFAVEELEDLEEKGYVINNNRKGETYADSYEPTEKFKEQVFNLDSDQTCHEFWNTYPNLIYVEGKAFSARNTNKELFFKDYYKKVGKDRAFHQRVMEALRYGKRNNLIRMNIRKFFDSCQWEYIEQYRLEQNTERESGSDLPSNQIL